MNESFMIEVGGTWQAAGVQTTYARVWGRDENGVPKIVASGAARVRKFGEPITVMIEGWRPAERGTWDRVSNGGAPDAWMIEAQRANTAVEVSAS